MKHEFELVNGEETQIKILYKLLSLRPHNISHCLMPSYDDHQKFVKNNPYLAWYIVNCDGVAIGSLYLKKDNSIGLNLHDPSVEVVKSCIHFITTNHQAQSSEASMVPKFFYVNIAASNEPIIAIMAKLNLEPLQISFQI